MRKNIVEFYITRKTKKQVEEIRLRKFEFYSDFLVDEKRDSIKFLNRIVDAYSDCRQSTNKPDVNIRIYSPIEWYFFEWIEKVTYELYNKKLYERYNKEFLNLRINSRRIKRLDKALDGSKLLLNHKITEAKNLRGYKK